MTDVEQRNVVAVVGEIVIAYVGGNVGIGTGSDGIADEFATRAAAQCHPAYHAVAVGSFE